MRTPKPIGCAECPLHKTGAGFVRPQPLADWSKVRLLVQGDAPGNDERDESLPFVGKAGHWLRRNIFGNAGLSDGQVWFDTVLRCQPPRNKAGDDYPIGADRKLAEQCCRQYDQWNDVPASVPLLCVGSKSLNQWFGVEQISEYHGDIRSIDGRLVGATYHPSAVMRNPNLLPIAIRETANLLEAARNPAVLKRPRVFKGFYAYRSGDAVVDLEWGGNGEVCVVGMAQDGESAHSTFDVEVGMEIVKSHINRGERIIGHNIITADLPKIAATPKSYGPQHVFDTKIVGHLVHAHLAELGLLSLDALACYYAPTPRWKTDKADLLTYNGYDCAYNYRLFQQLSADLTLTDQWHLVERQQRLAHMSLLMHDAGIKVDTAAITRFHTEWAANRERLKLGFPFNPNAPRQTLEWVKEQLKIELTDTTYDTIAKFADRHPLLAALRDYKDEGKSLKTWFNDDALNTGYIHPWHNVTGTAVARFSGSDPNCQNIPPHLRHIITARDESLELVSFDAKNLENRTVAYQSQDTAALDAFTAGLDEYQLTAAMMNGKRYEDVTEAERKDTKVTELASMYGETEYSLAGRLFGNRKQESVAKARKLQGAYFAAHQPLKRWQQRIAAQLDSGDVLLRNPFGRVRFIYAQDSHERMKRGCHFLGCSTGADHINGRTLDVWAATGKVPIMIVHDEAIYEVDKGDASFRFRQDAKEIFEQLVPELNGMVLPVTVKRGPNYGSLKVNQ